MKLFVVVSFMRAIGGARYEVQGAYTDAEVALSQIRDAALRDEIELEVVPGTERTFKGGGVFVTIHEVEIEGEVGSIAERSFTLGESALPLALAADRKLEGNGYEVIPAAPPIATLPQLPVDACPSCGAEPECNIDCEWCRYVHALRAAHDALRERHAQACLAVRDELIGVRSPSEPGQEELRKLLALLDPDHIFDDGA